MYLRSNGLGAWTWSPNTWQTSAMRALIAMEKAGLVGERTGLYPLRASVGKIHAVLSSDGDGRLTAAGVDDADSARRSAVAVLATARGVAGSDSSKHDKITAAQDLINNAVNHLLDRRGELEAAPPETSCGRGFVLVGGSCARISFDDDEGDPRDVRPAPRTTSAVRTPSTRTPSTRTPSTRTPRSAGGAALDTQSRDQALIKMAVGDDGVRFATRDGGLSLEYGPRRSREFEWTPATVAGVAVGTVAVLGLLKLAFFPTRSSG